MMTRLLLFHQTQDTTDTNALAQLGPQCLATLDFRNWLMREAA
jgi:hypothetical protein